MRTALHILFASCLLTLSASAHAQTVFDAAVHAEGLQTTGCLHFVDQNAVEARKTRWLRVIEHTWNNDPSFIADWVVGRVEPPEIITREAETQKNCMLNALIADAPKNGTVLDWGDNRHTPHQMREIQAKLESNPRFRANLLDWWTRSAWRGSREQSWIWHRKFTFNTNSFNRVSHHAATLCRIQPERTWDPTIGAHDECWRNRLSDEERQREILGASAAPGISRHHWGTDFDLFSLNPRNFLQGAVFHDEWLWMQQNAFQHGYFQPYQPHDHQHAYMEERWHWSYYPIAQALTVFARQNQDPIGQALALQWDEFESRWGMRRPNRKFFSYIREHWRDYMFTIQTKHPKHP